MSRPAVTFLGATRTVTGSKYLLETGDSRILIDCGLFQGLSTLRRRNWADMPFRWSDIDAVVITHAHLDHCGYLPVLARRGWSGPVYATEGTARLVEIVLADSAHLQEEEARQANEAGWSKHHPALPLYDHHDATRASQLLHPVAFDGTTAITQDTELTFGRAGHILGSAWAHLSISSGGAARTILTSGDLGRPEHPLLRPPEPRPAVDTLLIESTYGDRRHQGAAAIEQLAATISRTAARGGSVLVPAFAVDRTEVLLTVLAKLRQAGTIPDLPVVVDSPMALSCLAVYREALKARWAELRSDLPGDPFYPGRLVEVHTAQESALWNDPRRPAIIVSASGMASGGRVLHHLRHMLPNHRHTIAIIGFAAEGTRARQLIDGASEIKIHGQYVPVRADVLALDSLSAHADMDELFAWATAAPPPQTCYVVHGEQHSSEAEAARLRTQAGWTAVVPADGERVLI